jgi:hypothetical protein
MRPAVPGGGGQSPPWARSQGLLRGSARGRPQRGGSLLVSDSNVLEVGGVRRGPQPAERHRRRAGDAGSRSPAERRRRFGRTVRQAPERVRLAEPFDAGDPKTAALSPERALEWTGFRQVSLRRSSGTAVACRVQSAGRQAHVVSRR